MQCTLPHLCSCACLSAGHELAFFYPLGIIEAHEDDYIHGVFGGLFGAFVDTLIGAFDNAENELAKFFITILLAYRMLSACSACALPAADAAAARAPCKRSRARRRRRARWDTHEILGPRVRTWVALDPGTQIHGTSDSILGSWSLSRILGSSDSDMWNRVIQRRGTVTVVTDQRQRAEALPCAVGTTRIRTC